MSSNLLGDTVMRKYIVAYELTRGDNYNELYDVLSSYSDAARITESTWLVWSEQTCEEVRDEIAQCLSEKARVFVCGYVPVSAAGYNILDNDNQKIRNLLKRRV